MTILLAICIAVLMWSVDTSCQKERERQDERDKKIVTALEAIVNNCMKLR